MEVSLASVGKQGLTGWGRKDTSSLAALLCAELWVAH